MNIDNLKKKIQEANPSILELNFGCEFRMGDNPYNHRMLDYISPGIFIVWYPGFGTKQILWSTFTILGRPIRLADVLVAMQKLSDRDENRHHVINRLGEFLLYVKGYPGMVVKPKWNLLDDNLDHQSDECKQFLIDLLT